MPKPPEPASLEALCESWLLKGFAMGQKCPKNSAAASDFYAPMIAMETAPAMAAAIRRLLG